MAVGAGGPLWDTRDRVRLAVTGGWRLGFQLHPKDNKPIDLRAFLQKGDETLTETWSYVSLP